MEIIRKIFLLCLVALATDAKKSRLSALAPQASPGEFPYQVAIYLDGQFHCGGALISTTHVLTAGHCVQPMTSYHHLPLSQRAVVEVGSVRRGLGQGHSVARAVHHSQYGVGTSFSPNDIGVITLQTPVTESSNVKVIALPTAGTVVPAGARVVISGFGRSTPRGPSSPVLKKDTFKVVTQEECNLYYLDNKGLTITSSQICAKSLPGYGTCYGDSGSPFVYKNQVVGVVSGGDGTCGAGNPDVYTKVASYLDFIEEQMAVTPDSSTGQGQGVLPPAGNPLQPQIPGAWDPLGSPLIPGRYPEFPIFPPYDPFHPPIIYQ